MVSKCDPEYNDKVTITLCEKKQTELDSLVPVTEPLTNTHYKNKYCAYCNGVLTTSYLITWKLLVYSNQYVSFSTKNIVSTTKETRGNIFFIPPDTVKVRQCTSSYTIGTCNVTGDWNVYDKDFETACDIYLDPYTDPFGITYKNIFCYSCNTPTFGIGDGNDEVHCPSQEREKSKVDPAFSAIIDPKSFDKSGNQDSLYCTSHQFEDRKLVSQNIYENKPCHEIMVLYVLRKLHFQTRMRSHSVGLDI